MVMSGRRCATATSIVPPLDWWRDLPHAYRHTPMVLLPSGPPSQARSCSGVTLAICLDFPWRLFHLTDGAVFFKPSSSELPFCLSACSSTMPRSRTSPAPPNQPKLQFELLLSTLAFGSPSSEDESQDVEMSGDVLGLRHDFSNAS